jgi:protein PhnA
MSNLPKCPQCESEYTYEDGDVYICPECGHEWEKAGSAEATENVLVIKDAYGNTLNDGDSVTVIKDEWHSVKPQHARHNGVTF